MNVDSLALARASTRLLAQYLLHCPGCAKPSAAHVDAVGSPLLVRFVCPEGCAVEADTVLALLAGPHSRSA